MFGARKSDCQYNLTNDNHADRLTALDGTCTKEKRKEKEKRKRRRKNEDNVIVLHEHHYLHAIDKSRESVDRHKSYVFLNL